MKFLYPILFILTAATGNLQAQASTIYLPDQNEIKAEIVGVTNDAIRWRLYPDGASISELPMNRVAWVEFPPTKEWEAALEAMEIGKFNEAGLLFSAIAKNRRGNFYPAPGNFASLALKRILECHRHLLNSAQVAEIAKQLIPIIKSLPPAEQQFSPEDLAWIAAGRNKWDDVAKITAGASAQNTELSYLSGLAHRSLGDIEKALDGFTAAYALGFGSYPEIARSALRAAAEILATQGDEERLPEQQAQLKIYQELYGKGKLWEGAPATFVELAKADLDTLEVGEGDRETVIPPLPDDLPPRKDRDWLLAMETQPAIYVMGVGPLAGEGKSAPQKRGPDFVFSGAHFMKREPSRIDAPAIRFKAVFIPENKDGILFNAGKNGPGFTIFLKNGQLMLSWKQKADSVKQFALGPVVVGGQTTMNLVFRSDGAIKGMVSPQAMQDVGKVPFPISSNQPTLLQVAPTGKETIGQELPRFKGVIRHLSIGFAKTHKELAESESKMFGGKRVTLSVPVPKKN